MTQRGLIVSAVRSGAGKTTVALGLMRALARRGQPIILYMPMTQLAGITAALMKGGLAAETPAALLQSATTDDERCIESTLGRLVEDGRRNGIVSPAIAVIGATAGLRQQVLSGLVGWR